MYTCKTPIIKKKTDAEAHASNPSTGEAEDNGWDLLPPSLAKSANPRLNETVSKIKEVMETPSVNHWASHVDTWTDGWIED